MDALSIVHYHGDDHLLYDDQMGITSKPSDQLRLHITISLEERNQPCEPRRVR